MQLVKFEIKSNIFVSIISLLLGLVMFLEPDITIKSISIIFGIIFVLISSGPIINMIRNKDRKLTVSIAPSILLMIVAFILFFKPEIIISIIPILIGLFLMVSASFKLQNIYNLKRQNNIYNIWSIVVTMAILILGLLLIINPFGGVLAVTKLIGLFMIIYSALNIVDSIIMNNLLNNDVVIKNSDKKKN